MGSRDNSRDGDKIELSNFDSDGSTFQGLNPFEENEEYVLKEPHEHTQLTIEEEPVLAKKKGNKTKAVVITSITSSLVLFLLFLLFLIKDKKNEVEMKIPTKHSYQVVPEQDHGLDSVIHEVSRNEGESDLTSDGETPVSWRLDTANNYTSNLQQWRDDFGQAKERHYFFNITYVTKIDANGANRNLTVINGQFPGPLIEANSGDTIYLHVSNQMEDEPVSFHLHGLFYTNNTFDDGAASINVCPIAPGGNYTYRIPVGEKEYGTYWYHSHWSTQYADGVYGPVMLHSPKEDANLTYYDSDRVYVVTDYYYTDAADLLSTYLVPNNENSEPTPDAGLISGTYSQASNYITFNDNENKYRTATYYDPYSTYRVRVVNAGFFLPFEFSIDEHKLTLVEVEGTLIEPLETDFVDISVGERYSFFLNRTNADRDSYWVHARFNQFCLADSNPNFQTDVLSIVSYNAVFETPESSQTWQYSGGSPKCLDFSQSELRTLNQQVPMNKNGSNRPDLYVELDVSFLNGAYQMTYGYFNDYTWRGLSNTSTMHELLFNEKFRDSSHHENEQTSVNNQYILNFDKRDMIVDLLINNFDDGSHPFHLHGYKYWVLANSNSGSFYPSFYELYPDRLDLTNPVYRDTVAVAPFGYTVLRLVVDNPGIFPFHCHIGWHMEAGLLLQVNALQSEWSQMDYNPEWSSMCGYDFADSHLTDLINSYN